MKRAFELQVTCKRSPPPVQYFKISTSALSGPPYTPMRKGVTPNKH